MSVLGDIGILWWTTLSEQTILSWEVAGSHCFLCGSLHNYFTPESSSKKGSHA